MVCTGDALTHNETAGLRVTSSSGDTGQHEGLSWQRRHTMGHGREGMCSCQGNWGAQQCVAAYKFPCRCKANDSCPLQSAGRPSTLPYTVFNRSRDCHTAASTLTAYSVRQLCLQESLALVCLLSCNLACSLDSNMPQTPLHAICPYTHARASPALSHALIFTSLTLIRTCTLTHACS